MVAAEVLVKHIGNVHRIELLAHIVRAETVAVRAALHVEGHGRVGGAVEEAHRAGLLVPLEFRVVLARQIDRAGHGDDSCIVEAFGKVLLSDLVARADIIFRVHAVDGTSAAAADDNLGGIDVVLGRVVDEPGGGCIDVLNADVDGELERIVSFRGSDERFSVPAAGGAETVVYGDAYPAFLAEMVIQGVAKGVNPGTHRPGSAERVDEYRASAFSLLVLELIDVHQDRLGVAYHELHGGPVGLGHDLRLLGRLRVGADGQSRNEGCTKNQFFLHIIYV